MSTGPNGPRPRVVAEAPAAAAAAAAYYSHAGQPGAAAAAAAYAAQVAAAYAVRPAGPVFLNSHREARRALRLIEPCLFLSSLLP
jgi:hypothetical protein